MKVYDCMTMDVRTISPSDPIRKAAGIMSQYNIGYLPVVQDDRIVGSLTDRDIVVRAVNDDMDTSTSVERIMTKQVYYCFEHQGVDEVANVMAHLHVRRLPVVNHNKRLVGVVSIGDLSKSPVVSDVLENTYQHLSTH